MVDALERPSVGWVEAKVPAERVSEAVVGHETAGVMLLLIVRRR